MSEQTRIAWWTLVRDRLEAYKKALKDLENDEIIQLSMDDYASDLLRQAKRNLGELEWDDYE